MEKLEKRREKLEQNFHEDLEKMELGRNREFGNLEKEAHRFHEEIEAETRGAPEAESRCNALRERRDVLAAAAAALSPAIERARQDLVRWRPYIPPSLCGEADALWEQIEPEALLVYYAMEKSADCRFAISPDLLQKHEKQGSSI